MSPEDPDRVLSMHVDTYAHGIRMRLETSERWIVVDLPTVEAQKLAVALLAHTGAAAPNQDPC